MNEYNISVRVCNDIDNGFSNWQQFVVYAASRKDAVDSIFGFLSPNNIVSVVFDLNNEF